MEEGKMKNIWAMMDKPLTDMVTKKVSKRSTTLYTNDSSSDESNELEISDTESNCDFAALPKEFRPSLNAKKPRPLHEKRSAQIFPKKGLKEQQAKYPNEVVEKSMEKNPPNKSDEYLKIISAYLLGSSLQKETDFSSDDDKSPRQEMSTKSDIFQRGKKNKILRDNNERSDEMLKNPVAIDINTSQKSMNTIWNDELSSQSNTISFSNKSKNKKSFQYEIVQKVEHHPLQLNFDVLSFKSADSTLKGGVKYGTKLSGIDEKHVHTQTKNIKKSGRNARLQNQQFPASNRQNHIKWDSSLNFNVEQNSKFEWNYIREEKIVVTTKKNVTDKNLRLDSQYFSKNSCSHDSEANNSQQIIFNNLTPNETYSNQNSKRKTRRKNKAKVINSNSTSGKLHENSKSKNVSFENNSSIKYTHVIKQDFDDGKTQDIIDVSCIKKCEVNGQDIKNISCGNSAATTLDFLNVHFQERQNNLILNAERSRGKIGNLDEKNSQDIGKIKDYILHCGKEISDFIIGSYTALSMLVSIYREWTRARRKLITQFEELEGNLKESLKTASKYKDLIKIAKTGVDLASFVPHPAVSIAARIVSAVTSLLNTFLKISKEDIANLDDMDEITKAILKDNRYAVELKMHILQCSQQFEETTKLIKEFHANADLQGYFDDENPHMTAFIRGFLEYKPDHQIFYKKTAYMLPRIATK